MKVNIPDTKEKTDVAEMIGGSGQIGHIVGEMVTEPTKLKDFGFSDDIVNRAASIKAALKDDSTEIAVVRVEEGWSHSKRLWPAREIDGIVRQTNELEPVGHLGHIPDADESTSMPEPQTTWIGAFAKTEPSELKGRIGEMVRVAYFAGYNHPGAKIKSIIKARGVRGISWWGRAHQRVIPGKGFEMVDFDLKALDWARKGAEGMPSSSIVAIASEMKGNEMAEVDLAQVTPEQFKKDNPNGYALLVNEVKAESDKLVGEMQAKVDEGETAKSFLVKACELLGIEKPEDIESKITALKSKVGERAKATVDAGLAAIIKEKIPGDDNDQKIKDKRALVLRLLPVGEMETAVADSDEEGAKKLIGEMVDKTFNDDDVIKGIVSEMTPPIVRRREQLNRGGDSLDNNEYVTERSAVTIS